MDMWLHAQQGGVLREHGDHHQHVIFQLFSMFLTSRVIRYILLLGCFTVAVFYSWFLASCCCRNCCHTTE